MTKDQKDQLQELDVLVVQAIERFGPNGENVSVPMITGYLNELYTKHGYGAGRDVVKVFTPELVLSIADRCMGTGDDRKANIVFIA